MLKAVTENVFIHEDLCNVYVVRSGDKALCIDFGLGRVLPFLGEIGVSRVEWILHTHHHRDQCQGTHLGVTHGAQVAVPAAERHFFTQAELFVNRRATQNLYRMVADHFTLRESVPVARALADFTDFTWGGIDFHVLPTPGHTLGSISLRARIDGRWLLFCGDVMRAGSEIQTLYDLQYAYHDTDGFANLYLSLQYLHSLGCDLMLPSHGPAIAEPAREMLELMDRIRRWITFYGYGDRACLADTDVIEVAENLYCVSTSEAHSYCLLSRDGSALFIDYGMQRGQGFLQNFMHKGGEGLRFIPHGMSELKKRGLKKVDAFTPTHYHDDHLTGMPYLIREHGAELWAFEGMVPHLEDPRRELLGCSVTEPFKVDRAIADGERVRWKEYEFSVNYTPGHCDYHMSLFLEHDRQRIVISGDVMFNFGRKDDDGVLIPHWNLIYLNKTRANDHHRSALKIADFQPTVICPGHGKPFAVDGKVMRNFVDNTARAAAHLTPFVGERSLDEAMSPHWCQAIPFEQPVRVGVPFGVTVRITNLRDRSMNGAVNLSVPKGWRVTPDHRHLHVHAGSTCDLAFEVVALERKKDLPFVAYGINLELDGKNQGEISQGQVEFV